MSNAATADQYIGRRAVDPQGTKIGTVGQVYLDDNTGQPDWVTVNTGLFGMRENFVPLRGARIDGEDLVLPFDKDVVKDSPPTRNSPCTPTTSGTWSTAAAETPDTNPPIGISTRSPGVQTPCGAGAMTRPARTPTRR